jgi:hypothetical protein
MLLACQMAVLFVHRIFHHGIPFAMPPRESFWRFQN